MSHLDDDAIAAMAMGDAADPAARVHVSECLQCQARSSEFARLVDSLVAAGGDVTLVSAPARVLDGIRAELELGDSTESTPFTRPRPRWLLVAAAAAAGIVLGSAGLAALNVMQQDPGTVVARAELSDLATEDAAGSAEIRERSDGSTVLVVDTSFVSVTDAYLEVWLIDESVEGMVSLGHLTSGQGEFVLPVGFDFGAFPIVDISIEPNDGIPTHSGDSITRGVLAT